MILVRRDRLLGCFARWEMCASNYTFGSCATVNVGRNRYRQRYAYDKSIAKKKMIIIKSYNPQQSKSASKTQNGPCTIRYCVDTHLENLQRQVRCSLGIASFVTVLLPLGSGHRSYKGETAR